MSRTTSRGSIRRATAVSAAGRRRGVRRPGGLLGQYGAVRLPEDRSPQQFRPVRVCAREPGRKGHQRQHASVEVHRGAQAGVQHRPPGEDRIQRGRSLQQTADPFRADEPVHHGVHREHKVPPFIFSVDSMFSVVKEGPKQKSPTEFGDFSLFYGALERT